MELWNDIITWLLYSNITSKTCCARRRNAVKNIHFILILKYVRNFKIFNTIDFYVKFFFVQSVGGYSLVKKTVNTDIDVTNESIQKFEHFNGILWIKIHLVFGIDLCPPVVKLPPRDKLLSFIHFQLSFSILLAWVETNWITLCTDSWAFICNIPPNDN